MFGIQFPLCWRCSGIIAGSVALVAWLISKKRLPVPALSVALGLLLPLDLLYALITGTDGDNTRRLVTGVLWGFFGVAAVLHFVKYVRERVATRRLTAARAVD